MNVKDEIKDLEYQLKEAEKIALDALAAYDAATEVVAEYQAQLSAKRYELAYLETHCNY